MINKQHYSTETLSETVFRFIINNVSIMFYKEKKAQTRKAQNASKRLSIRCFLKQKKAQKSAKRQTSDFLLLRCFCAH